MNHAQGLLEADARVGVAAELHARLGRHGRAGALRPLGPVEAAEVGDHGREGGVVGHHVERARAHRAEAAAHGILDTVDELRVYPRVLEAHLQVVFARAAHEDALEVQVAELLEVDVPDPADVVAVGVVVVEEEGHEAAVRGLDLADHAVEARGVLGEVAHHVAAERAERLHAPARGLVRREDAFEALGGRAREVERGENRRHVEDHVEAVVAGVHALDPAGWPLDVPGVAAAAERHVARGEAELGALPAALGAAVLAELAVVDVVVIQGRVALGAEPRVADAVLLEARRLINPETDRLVVDALGDGRAQRVVRVVDERGRRRRLERLRDHVLGVVDLAVAVELVAEEVEKHERAGLELGQDAHGVELVALEGAEALLSSGGARARARLAPRDHGRGDARLHVVAGAVAHHVVARGGQAVGDEAVRGRLAVGARDDDGAVEAAREVGDHLRVELERDGARRVAAATAQDGREAPVGDVAGEAGEFGACIHGFSLVVGRLGALKQNRAR